jgi:hypothetical protein
MFGRSSAIEKKQADLELNPRAETRSLATKGGLPRRLRQRRRYRNQDLAYPGLGV